MHWRPGRLLAGAALAAAAPAAGAATVELEPAWSGYAVPGRHTELALTVSTPGSARVTLRHGAPPYRLEARWRTRPGVPRTVHLPVLAAGGTGGSPLELEVDGRAVAPLSWSPRWLEGVRLVASTLMQALPEQDRLRYVGVTPAALPRWREAYRTVAAIVLAGKDLPHLDPRQRAALAGHASACGRILLVAERAAPAWPALSAMAGCDAAGLARTRPGSPIHPAVRALLQRPLPDAGGAQPAAAARSAATPLALHAGLFLLAYATLLTAAARLLPPWTGPGLALAAAALAAVLWSQAPPALRWVAPSTEPGGSTTLAAVGRGRGSAVVDLPGHLGLPLTGGGAPMPRLMLDLDLDQGARLELPGRLFSMSWLAFRQGPADPPEAPP